MAYKRPSFRSYMIRNHINDDSPEGDLARDIKRDETFPKTAGSHQFIWYYLLTHGACRECLKTFDACWKRYYRKYKGAVT